MTEQSNFFTQQSSDSGQEPVVILNEPAGPPKKRVFVYDNQYFEDPGSNYKIEEVLGFLSQTYPELENGTWHSRTLPDGVEEITFVKVTGEKGAAATAHNLAACLAAGTTPTQIEAIMVLEQLTAAEQDGPLTAAHLLAAAPQIEAALHQAEQVASASQQLTARCLALTPVSLPRIPLGF